MTGCSQRRRVKAHSRSTIARCLREGYLDPANRNTQLSCPGLLQQQHEGLHHWRSHQVLPVLPNQAEQYLTFAYHTNLSEHRGLAHRLVATYEKIQGRGTIDRPPVSAQICANLLLLPRLLHVHVSTRCCMLQGCQQQGRRGSAKQGPMSLLRVQQPEDRLTCEGSC